MSRSATARSSSSTRAGLVRSSGATRTSAAVSARISSATASNTSRRREEITTLTPSAAIRHANAAPIPSEAPATKAHGP